MWLCGVDAPDAILDREAVEPVVVRRSRRRLSSVSLSLVGGDDWELGGEACPP